ncbi:MAG: cytochrome P450 [Novosphingobium sp.]
MEALSPAVPTPAHIPREAVYDFDMRADPGLLANPHERLREILHVAPPVFLTPRNGGRWIVSMLWQAEIEGEAMSVALMEDYCVLLFIAGLDTVINGMGFAMCHLAMNPDLQARLRAQPDLIVEAAEEMLRRYSFAVPQRRINKDCSFAGWTMKQNEWLVLYYPAANLDPREFASPENFDLARENKVHLAFGAGVHRCLGAHLARVELQVLYHQILKRLPPFRLDPDKPATFHSGNIIAMDSLAIRWD